MGRRRQRVQHAGPPAPPAQGIDTLTWVILIALAGAGLLTASTWQRIGSIEQRMNTRLDRIEELVIRTIERTAASPAPPAGQEPAPPQGPPDPDRVYDIRVDGAPVRGSVSAPITIAEFSDFQCPFCARVGPTLDRIEVVYGDRVRIVWKHYPLDIHPQAPGAHRAAVAAQKQGKFWEFHDLLFANQSQLDDDTYRRYAGELGLDLDRFERDRVDAEVQQVIDADMAEARSMRVPSTPGFFINGRFLRGAKPFEDFARLIDAELTRLDLPVPGEMQGG